MKFRFRLVTLLIVITFIALLAAHYGSLKRKDVEAAQAREELLKKAELKEYLAHAVHRGSYTLFAGQNDELSLSTDEIRLKLVSISENELIFQYRHSGMIPGVWLTKKVELQQQELSGRKFGHVWFCSQYGYAASLFILSCEQGQIEYSPDIVIKGR